MTTFITQARFTKDSLSGMLATAEDRTEFVGRLIAQIGGKLTACYLTSGDCDVLLIFEAPSYADAVPALLVAASESGLTDLKTVTALTSSEMKTAFTKAGSVAESYRSPAARAAGSSSTEPEQSKSDSQREGETSPEAQEEARAAKAILDAEKKAMDDIRAGRPAPYFLAAPESAATPLATSPSSTKSAGAVKKSKK